MLTASLLPSGENLRPVRTPLGRPGIGRALPGRALEQRKAGKAVFVDRIGDEHAVLADVIGFDVPLELGRDRDPLPARDVDFDQPPDVAVQVGDGGNRASIGREARILVAGRFLGPGQLGDLAAGEVEQGQPVLAVGQAELKEDALACRRRCWPGRWSPCPVGDAAAGRVGRIDGDDRAVAAALYRPRPGGEPAVLAEAPGFRCGYRARSAAPASPVRPIA